MSNWENIYSEITHLVMLYKHQINWATDTLTHTHTHTHELAGCVHYFGMIVTMIILKLYCATVRNSNKLLLLLVPVYSPIAWYVYERIIQKRIFFSLFSFDRVFSRSELLPVRLFIIELKRKTVQLLTMVSSPRAHSGNRNLFNAACVCLCVCVVFSLHFVIAFCVVHTLMLHISITRWKWT